MFNNNVALSKIFLEMSELYSLLNSRNRFRAIAYQNVSRVLLSLERDVADYDLKGELEEIDGIGKSIALKIREYLRTGKIEKHEALKKKFPPGLLPLLEIRSIGPATIKALHDKFKIRNKEDFIRLLKSERIKKMKGFGGKKIAKLLGEINVHDKASVRMRLWDAMNIANDWTEIIRNIPGVLKTETAGSLRRVKPDIGDIDILVTAEKRNQQAVIRKILSSERVKRILEQGQTRLSFTDKPGNRQVDIRMIAPESWGAALLYFTGSKEHNIHLREIARKKKMKINEYGLFDSAGKNIAGKTEEEIYQKLGFRWIPPELREDKGELELSKKNALPELISQGEIRGDFEMHSDWSDGKNTIAEIAAYVKENFPDYRYIVLTDHSKSERIAGGMNSAEFKKQWKEIDKVNGKTGNGFIKKGVEVDILKDGSLDLDDETLKMFDWVTASIHSGFSSDNTDRILKACKHPLVNAIGHPTGRLTGIRNSYPLDMEKILTAAHDTGTALEINAQPDRMDMDEIWTRKAKEKGVKIIIGTDSHRLNEYHYMTLGLSIARRAGCVKEDVLNTMQWKDIEKFVLRKRKMGLKEKGE